MSDEIRSLTARLAEEPASLAFLELAEALRRRGQLAAAAKVARGGAVRYPGLAEAHDLLGRILSDEGDLAGAFDAWATALRLDPLRVGALKGMGFLYYRAGDRPRALEHLTRAAELDPDNGSIRRAVERVGGAAAPAAAAVSGAAPGGAGVAPDPGNSDVPGSSEPGAGAILVVDGSGFRLGGSLWDGDEEPRAEAVAAHVAAAAREAARVARLLDLGEWQTLVAESPDGSLVLAPAAGDTTVLTACGPGLPAGRLARAAESAVRGAREWLERVP